MGNPVKILTCKHCGREYRHSRQNVSGYCPDKPCQRAYGREKALTAAGPTKGKLEENMRRLQEADRIAKTQGYDAAAEYCRQNKMECAYGMYSRHSVNPMPWVEGV